MAAAAFQAISLVTFFGALQRKLPGWPAGTGEVKVFACSLRGNPGQ